MKKLKNVRLGIVGIGGMGSGHARLVQSGKAPGLTLAAVCDERPERKEAFPDVPFFTDPAALFGSGAVDAVLIATPHYSHTTLGAAALAAGLHTLVEKPISVHKTDAEKLIAAHQDKQVVFAAMFNQRTDPRYVKLKQLLDQGELGAIQRVSWNITDWYRTEAYYASGGWRATWSGEGGGVLLNQCPHQLDLLQWLFGMPQKVRAFCQFGRFHEIEVEDAVTAHLEYASGATATFITTTGETPGVNRLEVAADRGLVVIEGEGLRFIRNERPASEHRRTDPGMFSRPVVWNVEIPTSGRGEQHTGILKNFADAILKDAPLIAPAAEGIRSVELANAMLYSGWREETVALPLDGTAYAGWLAERIRSSKPRKAPAAAAPASASAADMSQSFGKR